MYLPTGYRKYTTATTTTVVLLVVEIRHISASWTASWTAPWTVLQFGEPDFHCGQSTKLATGIHHLPNLLHGLSVV